MIPKLDPDRFYRAFETINMVEEGSVVPIRSLAGATINLEGDEYTFTNNPILRMVEATRVVFPERIEGLAASMRLFYLFDVIDKKEVAPLLQIRDGQMLVHESLVKAMGEIDIDEDGGYDIHQLVELAKTHLRKSMVAQ